MSLFLFPFWLYGSRLVPDTATATSRPSGHGPGARDRALAKDRLGPVQVMFMVMAGAAPLVVVGGVVPTGYGIVGSTAVPAAFAAVWLILTVFSVGYVAMAERIVNAGAFYAYLTRGLGRHVGVAGAWVSVLAYNLLQFGLYGGFGAIATPLLLDWTGIHLPWWVVALPAWGLVAVLGLLRIDLNGRLLGVLLTAEIAIIAVYSVANLLHPADGGLTTDAVIPNGPLLTAGVGAVLGMATLGFVGFENSAVYAEEARHPARTVRIACLTALAVSVTAYVLGSASMTVATGSDQIAARAAAEGPALLFNLAAVHLGSFWVTTGQALLLTSLLAGMISFHNTAARYTYALGRERVLPAFLGATSRHTSSPKYSSGIQSTLGFSVIIGYGAVFDLDPLIHLFFWLGTAGGLGVLMLLTATSLAILTYFKRHPEGVSRWQGQIAPAAATALLAGVLGLAIAHFDVLLGVNDDSPAAKLFLGAYVIAAALGALWAVFLRSRNNNPDSRFHGVFDTVGLGAQTSTAATTAAPQTPAARTVQP